MSLKPQRIGPVPSETARVARAAYPKGNLYIQMRTVLGCIYTDEDFVDLFPKEGQPKDGSMATRPGHRVAIHREPFRSTSGRCRTCKDRLAHISWDWN